MSRVCPVCGGPRHEPGLKVDLDSNTLVYEGEVLAKLRPAEAEFLYVLSEKIGTPIRREAVVAKMWGHNPPRTADDVLDVYASHLRKSLLNVGYNLFSGRSGFVRTITLARVHPARQGQSQEQ
jgi:DNA-binding response OmpR family regulator